MYPGGAPTSRATVCRSWYSDMSSRTIARSSSNMNSASARASSVLPTPVGPRKTNEPIGRFGSCRPVRERRNAFATAAIASSWPTTRSCSRCSMWISFSVSPSSKRETGIPLRRPTGRKTVGDLQGIGELALDRLAHLGRLLRHRSELDLELRHAPVRLVQLDRRGVDLHPQARRGLVHEVDCLVGQEAVGDVA